MSGDAYKPATVAEIRQKLLDRLRNEWGTEEIDVLVRCYLALGSDPLKPKRRQ